MNRTALIVDDEPLARSLLTAYIERTEGLVLAAAFHDPIEALRYLRYNGVDVIFLDVKMEGLSGIQFAKIIGKETAIILATAFEEYALEGYDLNVLDYLLKPISYPRFVQAVNKLNSSNEITDVGLITLSTPQNSVETAYIFVKSGHQHQRVDLADIRYCSSDGDYVSIYLNQNKRILTLENLSSLADRLPTPNFFRIHRSHLVALDKITLIERNRVVIDGVYLPISQSYREAFWHQVEGRI